jgi:KDO2-lipid IV(A) lauroyltransferase
VVRKNLNLSFPEKNQEELKVIERAFYRHLCDIFIEILKALTVTKKQVLMRYQFNNLEVINQYLRKNRGVVLVCGHYSSWEAMLSIGYHLEGKGYAVYAPLSNKYFERMIVKSRAKHLIHLGSRFDVLQDIEMHQKNNSSYIYGLAADQSHKPKPKSYWRSFMGIEVPVFTGAERMARQFDLPIVFADINRAKRGYYTLDISLITDKPKETKVNEITDIFTETLEAQIRKDPSQYLWTHNRFKHMDKNPKLVSQSE